MLIYIIMYAISGLGLFGERVYSSGKLNAVDIIIYTLGALIWPVIVCCAIWHILFKLADYCCNLSDK